MLGETIFRLRGKILRTDSGFKNGKEYPMTRRYLRWLNQQNSLTQEPKLESIPFYGELIPFNEFIESCEMRALIDYDGYGKYSTQNQMSDITIRPSDIQFKRYRKDFSHVVWFNR